MYSAIAIMEASLAKPLVSEAYESRIIALYYGILNHYLNNVKKARFKHRKISVKV